MAGKRLPIVAPAPEPLEERIATGLHKIGLAMKQRGWQQANSEGLSATQGQLLAALLSHGPLSGTELGERLGVTLPTISDSVRALVEKGLATRSADPRHPRAKLVTLTEKGAEVGARARAWPEFMAQAVAELEPDEQRAFYGGIVKMIRSLQEQGLVPFSGMCATCTHLRPNVRTGPAPHHCAFVDAPIASDELRLDCPEHELADDRGREQLWKQLVRRG